MRIRWFSNLIVTIMISSMIVFNTSQLSSWSIIICVVLMLLAYLIQHKAEINFFWTSFHTILLSFAVYCMLSSVWAVSSASTAVEWGMTILELLVCMSVVFMCYQEEDSIVDLLKAAMWSGPLITLFSVFYFGFDEFMQMLQSSERMGNTFSNANAIGMWMAISIVIFVYLILNKQGKLTYALGIIPLFLLIMSQSRTAMVEMFLGIVLVVVFRFRDNKDVLISILKILLALTVLVIAVFFLSRLKIFSGINERMESIFKLFTAGKADSSGIRRNNYIQAGWIQFLEKPIFGIGIRNTNYITMAVDGYNTYLHNNYVELLAGGGIIGFLIFYSMYFFLGINLFSQIKAGYTFSEICVIILTMMLLADYGNVSFYTKETYILFTICALQIFQYEQKQERLNTCV